MKKSTLILAAAALGMAAPLTSYASGHEHMDMGYSGHSIMGNMAHQEVIDGVKATFKIMNMKEHMKGMEMPRGMKETHHVMVEFKDAKSGKALTEGTVKVKIQRLGKAGQTKDLIGMQGHFGADFDLSKKGKYGVMCRFQLKDGKVRSSMFWYTVK